MSYVGMVVYSHYPADPRVRREAEALERAGIAVDVICLRNRSEAAEEHYGQITAYRVMKGAERKEGVFDYLLTSTSFGLRAMMKLLALSAKRKYSLVQAHNMPDFLVFAGLIHKLMGRPVILDLHDLTVELFESKCKGKKIAALKPLVKIMEKASCAFADGLITTSSGFKEKLVQRGIDSSKITLVLNTADNNIFSTPPQRKFDFDKNGPRLLYHGTVARRFGLHVAIQAVPRLLEKMPNTKLSIYGKYDPSYRDELCALVKSLGLEDSVTLGGFLTLDKVIEVIGSSDIGVVPYLSDPFMDLALSTKVFEYVCMRMPVIASRVNSITSVFDDDSICYFRPGDPDDLSRKIETFWKEPERRKKYAERASQSYSSIAWPVMSKRYIEKVKGLMCQDGHR